MKNEVHTKSTLQDQLMIMSVNLENAILSYRFDDAAIYAGAIQALIAESDIFEPEAAA